jgi:NADH-quinone oxidoreductase subunit A
MTEPNPELSPLFTLFLLFCGALAFALAPLAAAWLWSRFVSPAKPGPEKNATYECGLSPTSETPSGFRSQYYLYAIVFLVFDVETVFLLPFAAAYPGLPLAAVLAMLVFVLLLAEGLIWAWNKGVLTWE